MKMKSFVHSTTLLFRLSDSYGKAFRPSMTITALVTFKLNSCYHSKRFTPSPTSPGLPILEPEIQQDAGPEHDARKTNVQRPSVEPLTGTEQVKELADRVIMQSPSCASLSFWHGEKTDQRCYQMRKGGQLLSLCPAALRWTALR